MAVPTEFATTADLRVYIEGLGARLVPVIDGEAEDDEAVLDTYEFLKGAAPWLIGEYGVEAFSADELLGGLNAYVMHLKE